jgi:hypothetical protein
MSENNVSLRTWIENYEKGLYNSGDRNSMCDAGWYDWFCGDDTLLPRLKNLYPKVLAVSKSEKINLDTMYVFFKNNCPMDGKLYDDFRICDMETGDVIWTISPAVGYTKTFGQSEVWGKENDFEDSIVAGTMLDVLTYFGVEENVTMEILMSEEFEDDSDDEDEDEELCDCGHNIWDCVCGDEEEDEDDE